MATGQFPPVGQPVSSSQFDAALSEGALLLRNLAELGLNVITPVNAYNKGGLAYLVKLGYSNTLNSSNPDNPPDPNNPGNPMTDAGYALYLANLMGQLIGLYKGTATQPAVQNFEQALSILWAGRT